MQTKSLFLYNQISAREKSRLSLCVFSLGYAITINTHSKLFAGRFNDNFSEINTVVGHQQKSYSLRHIGIFQCRIVLICKPIVTGFYKSTRRLDLSVNTTWADFLIIGKKKLSNESLEKNLNLPKLEFSCYFFS